MTTLRDRQRDTTRILLLQVAGRLVGASGPEAATTRAIARAAGVATGTVFAHFPDKTTLLEALLVDHVEAALDAAMPTAPADDVVEALVHVAGHLWAAYDRAPALSRTLLAETLFLADPDRPLNQQLQRFSAWVAERLTAGVARGAIAPLEPRLVFSAYFSMYFGLLVGGLRGEVTPDARADLLRGLLTRLLHPALREVP